MNLGGHFWIVANEVATAPRDPSGELEVITSKILQLPSWCGLLTITTHLCHRWQQMFRCGNHNPAILSSFVIMTGFVTITTRLVPLVEQELLTVLEFTSVFNLVRVVHFLGYFYLSCIIVCRFPTRFPFHMMLVSFINNTTGVASGAGTANLFGTPVISGDRIVHSLVFLCSVL